MSKSHRRGEEDAGPSNTKETRIALETWVERYGVIGDLLPFEHRMVDPFEVVRTAVEYTSDLPPTKATLSWREFRDVAGIKPSASPQSLYGALDLVGIWYIDSDAQSQQPYLTNPNYVHKHTLFNPEGEERVGLMRRFARYGTHGTEEFAPRMGVKNKKSVVHTANRHGLCWADLRDEGHDRLRRTVMTLDAWGKDRDDIAMVVGRETGTIHRWIHQMRKAGFEPPRDPSHDGFGHFHDRGTIPVSSRDE